MVEQGIDARLHGARDRTTNHALIMNVLGSPGDAALSSLCSAISDDFSPSLFAELDYQEFRPDVDDNTRQILGYVDDFAFFYALPGNIAARFTEDPGARLSHDELESYTAIFFRWQEVWLTPARDALLDELDAFLDECTRPQWQLREAQVLAEAGSSLAAAIAAVSDPERVTQLVEVALNNVIYALLDLPWTRRRVKAAVRAARQSGLAFPPLGTLARPSDTRALVAGLVSWKEIGDRAGLGGWSDLVGVAIGQVEALTHSGRRGQDGQWALSWSPCGRCSMWFAAESLSSLDSTCGFVDWSSRRLVFIPAGVCSASCPFCGFTAPLDAPMMFYARHRNQVVYLIPTKGVLTEEAALELWRPTFEAIRRTYLEQVSDELRAEFESAAELVTHDVRQFLLAVQMGETIQEDHVATLIPLPDGQGLVFDGEKRFARVVTAGEFRWMQETVSPVVADPETALAYERARADLGLPEQASIDLTSADAVAQILSSLLDLNDAIDAKIAAARHPDAR